MSFLDNFAAAEVGHERRRIMQETAVRHDEYLIAERAETRLWADVDSYTDWLASECHGADIRHVNYYHDACLLDNLVRRSSVAELVWLQNVDHRDVSWAAQREIKRRYLAEKQGYLRKLESDARADVEGRDE